MAWLIQLSEAGPCALGDIVNILVLAPGDSLEDLSSELGFSLEEEAPENVEIYAGWFELTFIVNGEGFGYWVFVPKSPGTDCNLLAYCLRHCPSGEDAP
ncbi:hypothetical protein JI739_18695 [Ramlibacter sp. AW1]|uniref:Uncharacterized protein n=1 Tax=Ramlibacter aurantiacus TaxID=2801330 RepID=A0A936ZXN3_9BURK|nr:hypothetical protein [Ramlibacter aurantiacus]